MKRPKIALLAVLSLLTLGLVATAAGPAVAFHEGGLVLLDSHSFTWVDPDSGGEVVMTEKVWEGCIDEAGAFIPHDMTWQYVVDNISYNPHPGITNGFSGFQILFPGPVAELYAQTSPAIGGPWQQNAFSGQFPPFGVEWDAPLPGAGILPGESGTFSFCTFERMDVVVESEGIGGGPAGWGHTWGLAIPEPIVDADGSVSRFDGVPGSVEVAVLDTLTTWPTGRWNQGLDMFDTDGSGTWTAGDDLHVEDPLTHPGAIRQGLHDDFLDPLVLDLDNSLDTTPGNEPVSCDLETGTFCPAGFPWTLAFFDSLIPNGFWDDGEDIVLDLNGDLIFGEVVNTQSFIFHGPQSVPGPLMYVLDLDACSPGHLICKKVKYMDDGGDGVIDVGEPVWFLEVIQVHNPSAMTWTGTIVKDRWGAELDVTSAVATHGTTTLTTKGKSAKEFLTWNIGDLGPGMTANLVLEVHTDLNPGGHQEYTSPGEYEYNSGAVLKFFNENGKRRSFSTGSVFLTVVP